MVPASERDLAELTSDRDLAELINTLGRLTPAQRDLRDLGDRCLLLIGWSSPKPQRNLARGFRWGWETPAGEIWAADPQERPNPLTAVDDAIDWMVRPLGFRVTLHFEPDKALARLARDLEIYRGASYVPEIALTIACLKAIYGRRLRA